MNYTDGLITVSISKLDLRSKQDFIDAYEVGDAPITLDTEMFELTMSIDNEGETFLIFSKTDFFEYLDLLEDELNSDLEKFNKKRNKAIALQGIVKTLFIMSKKFLKSMYNASAYKEAVSGYDTNDLLGWTKECGNKIFN